MIADINNPQRLAQQVVADYLSSNQGLNMGLHPIYQLNEAVAA